MSYVVQVAEDGELPDGVERVIVEQGGDSPCLVILAGLAARRWVASRRWDADFQGRRLADFAEESGSCETAPQLRAG